MLLVERQRPYLQAQISMRMRELNCDDYSDYFQLVVTGVKGMAEWSILVDRLVVNETSFFRHRPSIEFIRSFLQRRIDAGDTLPNFDVWSLGCSSGEETYSLAMVINDCYELANLQPYYGVTGTDISTKALAIAKEGRYNERQLEQVTPGEAQRYLTPVEMNNGRKQSQVSAKLRDRICFSQGNVLNLSKMPAVPMDIIFCQNLLIYFRRWLRRDILNNLVDHLKPGGILIIGLGEAPDWKHPQMTKVNNDAVQAYTRTI
jgi:chemotaxis protein methyltransferase CheR/type IV pilus assembly protein PilK